MTGEQYYHAHHGTAIALGIEYWFAPWEDLSALDRLQWECLAFEQNLRDRDISDIVLTDEKGL